MRRVGRDIAVRCPDPATAGRRPYHEPAHDAVIPLLFGVRFNVLIYPEEIVGIVFVFDRNQPLVVVSVRRLHAIRSLVAHQKVYISSTSRIRVERIIIVLRPRDRLFVVRGIGIDTDHHLRPGGIAIVPSGGILADP
jgi:hypothetical protein